LEVAVEGFADCRAAAEGLVGAVGLEALPGWPSKVVHTASKQRWMGNY